MKAIRIGRVSLNATYLVGRKLEDVLKDNLHKDERIVRRAWKLANPKPLKTEKS